MMGLDFFFYCLGLAVLGLAGAFVVQWFCDWPR